MGHLVIGPTPGLDVTVEPDGPPGRPVAVPPVLGGTVHALTDMVVQQGGEVRKRPQPGVLVLWRQCDEVLAERGKPVTGTPDVSTLTKETLRELKLVPEGIPEAARGADVIKRLLSNLGTIGNGLAELRGLYGTGHGKDGSSKGLSARHAKLAVGAASTLAVFLFETHRETK